MGQFQVIFPLKDMKFHAIFIWLCPSLFGIQHLKSRLMCLEVATTGTGCLPVLSGQFNLRIGTSVLLMARLSAERAGIGTCARVPCVHTWRHLQPSALSQYALTVVIQFLGTVRFQTVACAKMDMKEPTAPT